MRLKTLCTAALCALLPGIAAAQNYRQDFSATFPPKADVPGKVSVTLFDQSTGTTIKPFVDYEVNGLNAYAGRPQFGGRTGGANSNEEVGNVSSVYRVGANSTTVQYPVDPLPAVGGANYTPDRVLDPNFITLAEKGINSITSAAAWDEAYSGAYDSVTHTFDFRLSEGNPTSNDNADGIGWSYLNSEQNGTSGIVGPNTSEEPGYGGSLGVGFDIWDNGGEGGNSVSLHFNGRTLLSRNITDGNDPSTGQPWAFNSMETGDIIRATIEVKPGAAASLDPPSLLGGSPYTIWNRSGLRPELIQVGNTGTQGYLRVAPEAGGVANVIAFAHDGSAASDEYHVSFDFRGLSEEGSRADGMSFLLVPVETYGAEGAETIAFGPHEEPSLAGAFGVGFDTFNSDGDAQDEPEGRPNVGNHVSIHFDGAKLSQTNFDPTEDLDLVTTDPTVWHNALIDIKGDTLSVTITDGADASVHVITENIPGLSQMGAVRPVFAARTGGAFDNYEIDNFVMRGKGLPCDFDGNGTVDVADINMLSNAIRTGTGGSVYDVNGDNAVNLNDLTSAVADKNCFNTYIGDANFDGQFNSGDLVTVFAAGEYEDNTALNSTWGEGDWNADGDFNTGDLVFAFQGGGYEAGPRAAVSAVPEPSSLALLSLGALLLVRRRK